MMIVHCRGVVLLTHSWPGLAGHKLTTYLCASIWYYYTEFVEIKLRN